jgi:hypothetical protein
MKQLVSIILFVVAAALALAIVAVFAAASLSSWPYFVDITPRGGAPGTYDLVVPLQVMDKSREDLADLRLYDVRGREIPYALRIRKEVDDNREIAARLFNEASIGSRTSEVSVDLGENAGEHNEVQIETPGANFRRRVDLEGSDSGKEWRALMSGRVIYSFESQNKTVELNRVNYPTSRYRYLRVRVFADELTDDRTPAISAVKVVMAVREKGVPTTWGIAVPPYQLLRNQGAPASAWTIDLGAQVPCDRLTLEVQEESFSRPFQLEAIDDPQNIRLVASGELTRRTGEARRPLVITFDKEEHARKLRLLITDYSNQTLSITSINAAAPARQLVFELKEAAAQPLRLFFGNANAAAPHYDFEQELPAKLATAPAHSEVGAVVNNPDYTPEPLPFTERIPWLIYVVLAASSLALAIILIRLARTSLRTEPQRTKEANVPTSTG